MSVANNVLLPTLLVAVLIGCSPSTTAPSADDPSSGPSVSTPGEATAGPVPAPITDAGELRRRADVAMREGRITAPAGDNAAEYFIALRQLSGQAADVDVNVNAALLELQPYLVLAIERALEQDEVYEAMRLLGMLTGIDAQAPALPRLQATLEDINKRIARTKEATALASAATQQIAVVAAPTLASPTPPAAPVTPAPAQAWVAAEPQTRDAQGPAVARTAPAVPPPATLPQRIARAMPKLLQEAPPRYPVNALRRRVEGQVELAFTIQRDGSISNPTVVSSQPRGTFDDAALDAAKKWRFENIDEPTSVKRVLHFSLPRG